jgi:signal transduction histidine kinase
MPGIIRECQELTTKLVHLMLDRARHFTSSYLHDEKLVSLGKLAAGLAHELNNPASAIARSAGAITSTILKADATSRTLGALALTKDETLALEKVRTVCISGTAHKILSPLQQEEREDAFVLWLKGHGMAADTAEALAETDVTFDVLDQLAASLQREALDAALQWLAAVCATRRLTSEIHEAATRISELVTAIKGFTEMDRESVPEPLDIGRGLRNTLTVLRSKAKRKSAGVTTNVQEDLPLVNGFGSELNQVWANLIDNALDAVGDGGHIQITAAREGQTVVVRVVDDGPGIPSDIRDRIFDPFFTTKPVGKGTGLGLDIVRRLVQRHNGQIELDSTSGRTEFRVTLPVAEIR